MTYLKTQDVLHASSDNRNPYSTESTGLCKASGQSIFKSSYYGDNAWYYNNYNNPYFEYSYDNTYFAPGSDDDEDSFDDKCLCRKHKNSGLFEEFGESADHALNKHIVSPIKDGVDTVADFEDSISERISGTGKDIWNETKQVGNTFIVNPIKGIGKGLGTIADAIVSPFTC